MIQKVFLVDALTDGPFSGAPISVFWLESPVERFKMASLASEVGSLESVYVLPHGEAFLIRSFSQTIELKLGVHSCLAAAHIIYDLGMRPPDEPVLFLTQTGEITANFISPDICSLEMDSTPLMELKKEQIAEYASLLSLNPGLVTWGSILNDELVVLAVDDYNIIKHLVPNIHDILKSKINCIAATAPNKLAGDCDYYLRSFKPQLGQPEEQVSGYINRSLAINWSKILRKNILIARQLSRRGGLVTIEVKSDNHIILRGRATTVLRSDIILENLMPSIP
ncbi:MAG: PhzF family phenazine biosynthesis protein [Deltaproteobacteria bacterium]|jgi:PhzF family phenazine biosynthesis protein|nr:PhzF family phenazine biosynthesis protein [Deltaproteobacteria bacterium]